MTHEQDIYKSETKRKICNRILGIFSIWHVFNCTCECANKIDSNDLFIRVGTLVAFNWLQMSFAFEIHIQYYTIQKRLFSILMIGFRKLKEFFCKTLIIFNWLILCIKFWMCRLCAYTFEICSKKFDQIYWKS